MVEETPDPERLSFESARDKLREKGYLDRGVEGAVLKGALAARTRAASLVFGAAVGAVFLAGALALSQAVLLAVASALPVRDALVLFLWLFLPALLAAALLVLVLVGVAFARTRARGDADGASTEIAIAFGLLAGIGGALTAVPALEAAGPAAAVGVLVVVTAAVFIAVRVARGVTFTVLATSGRAVLARRRNLGLVVAALAGLSLLLALGFWLTHRPGAAPEPLVVTANARRVVVVGVDGWSDRYASPDAAPAPPAVGTESVPYTKAARDTAAFWTTIATGENVKRHGIGSLDLVRVAGVGAPLRPSGGAAWFLGHVLPGLGLARRESVTAAARRVPSAWEVANRAGIASLVVNWWTTYPAADGGGTVLGNHLFFAARAGAKLDGEGWPQDAVERAASLAPRVAPEPGSVERLMADAEGLDDFSARAFLDASAREKPRLSFLYLPGLDILASALAESERPAADRVALASAMTKEARKIQALLEGPLLAKDADLFILLLDAGRNEPGGVVRFAGPLALPSAPAGARLAPEDIAPTALAVLGVPASREVPGKVRADLLAKDAATAATVGSWGRRRADARVAIDPKEYVENLRSLGYLK